MRLYHQVQLEEHAIWGYKLFHEYSQLTDLLLRELCSRPTTQGFRNHLSRSNLQGEQVLHRLKTLQATFGTSVPQNNRVTIKDITVQPNGRRWSTQERLGHDALTSTIRTKPPQYPFPIMVLLQFHFSPTWHFLSSSYLFYFDYLLKYLTYNYLRTVIIVRTTS